MRNKISILMLPLLLSFETLGYEINWKEITVDPHVKVYAGNVAGLNLVAFKGKDILNHKMSDVISALADAETARQWMSSLAEASIVETIGPTERIDYNHQLSPWPISNRDFVFRITTEISSDQKQVIFNLKSEAHEKKPVRAGIVRGQLLKSYFKLQALDAGNNTELEIMMLVDPKGYIPIWLVNIVNRNWAPYTINGLRKFLDKKQSSP